MPREAFHPRDLRNVIGPAEAFDLSHQDTPSTYALQNHLAFEIVAHLQEAGVPFKFRGGTPLQARLGARRRFSSDADLTTPDKAGVHDALRRFTKRYPHSEIHLREPPEDLRVDGVRHILEFGHTLAPGEHAPVRVLVEAVEDDDTDHAHAPLRLQSGPHDWQVTVQAPTLEAFLGQKLAVLGPETVGKPVGLNRGLARQNQSVCKQIFDLREILKHDLDEGRLLSEYKAAISQANRLHGTRHPPEACLEDAERLLNRLREPRTTDDADPVRYGLWAGYRDSRRWITRETRDEWRETDYRIAGGVLARLSGHLNDDLELDNLRAPLVQDRVPDPVQHRLENARQEGADWLTEDLGIDARLAWSWAPREIW